MPTEGGGAPRLRPRGFDLLVRGARVVPGDGPARVADVGVRGARIEAVQPDLAAAPAAETIDGRGLMLLPGFVDMHAHSALRPFQDPHQTAKIAQGFTSEVIHPDGLAPAPVAPERREARRAALRALEGPGPDAWPWSTVAEHLEALSAARPATTLVPSIGHNAVRDHVMGGAARAPTAEELRAMRRELAIGLDAGARMLSLGLFYPPGVHAATDELVALCREAAPYGAPLAVHVRNEAGGVLDAVGEMIHVARTVGAPLHLSHLKVLGHPHLVEPLLATIDEAAHDHPVTFDQYPYGAGSTSLTALLPPWAQEGDADAVVARLRDRAARDRLGRDVDRGLPGWENSLGSLGPEAIVLANAAGERTRDVGRTLAEVARAHATSPTEALADLLVDTRLDATMVHHYASERAVRQIFRHPLHMVGSDGIFGERPHPRLYGSAARALGRYALRDGEIAVEEAAARLATRPADLLQLQDRGRIRPGARADLVLLDPERYVDTATYEEPKQVPPGMRGVWVAGRCAYRDGGCTGVRAGGVVRTARSS